MTGIALVTGATGYLGSHLVPALVNGGWDVHVVVRPSSELDRLGESRSRVTVHVDDGTVDGLAASIGASALDVDVCFHLAAACLGRHRPSDVPRLVESNLDFPLRLAEVLASSRAPIFVNTGTAWQHVDGAGYAPAALYAATKQAFEDLLGWYAADGSLRVITLVLYDTYGPTDPRRKFLGLVHDAQRERRRLPASPGEQLIDLTYVDDVVRAFLAAPTAVEASGASPLRYAVGSRQPVTLRELVEVVEHVTGERVDVEWGALPYRDIEMLTYWNAGPVLPGWEPLVPLVEGIARVWAA